MSQREFSVAVAGATGVVGNRMIACLEERNFPVGKLTLLASERSKGKKLKFRGEEIPVPSDRSRILQWGGDRSFFRGSFCQQRVCAYSGPERGRGSGQFQCLEDGS